MLELVEPLVHRYVYGVVPPLVLTLAVPVAVPLHKALLLLADAANTAGSVIVMLVVAAQPFASVTV